MRKIINTENYDLGDTRIREKFLIFPMTLKNKDGVYEKRWWEYAKWEEKIWTIYTEQKSKKIKYGWYRTKWVN